MILIVAPAGEPMAALVIGRLREAGLDYHVLDPEVQHDGPSLHAVWRAGALHDGWFAGPGWRVDFGALTGIFIRLAAPPDMAATPSDDDAARRASERAERMGLLCTVLDALPCTVINKLLGGISNMSKPHQGAIIRECGLAIPQTLVTNDCDAVDAFAAEHGGEVITKSLSGIRSIVRRVGPTQRARLPLLRHGPAQFQALIPGIDIRVHIVGDRVFATRIDSTAVDYRYGPREGKPATMHETTLPDEIATKCVKLARRLDLMLAGIDLKVTPDGEHICFEANPAPAFIAYEAVTRQPISAAIAALLSGRGGSGQAPTFK